MKLKINAWSSRFIGTAPHIEALLALLEEFDGGKYKPDRWNFHEPLRHDYNIKGSKEKIVSGWIEERPPLSGRIVNNLYFKKLGGSMEMHAYCSRSWEGIGTLNDVQLRMKVKPLGAAITGELFAMRLTDILDPDLLTVCSSEQSLRRSVGGTPLNRIEQIDWLMYWGRPYVRMLGRERILAAPWHKSKDSSMGGLFTWVSETPDDSRLTSSCDLQQSIEAAIGKELFPSGSSIEHCVAPQFDLSELRIPEFQINKTKSKAKHLEKGKV